MGWELGERREGIGVRFWVIDGEEGIKRVVVFWFFGVKF